MKDIIDKLEARRARAREGGGKALQHAFPRFADDLAWWMEAARAQRERKQPPY